MDYNLFDTVKRIWALGKCAIEINYLLLLLLLLLLFIIRLSFMVKGLFVRQNGSLLVRLDLCLVKVINGYSQSDITV